MQQNKPIRKHTSNGAQLRVFKDYHDKYKTTVSRVDKLQSNVLYEGYDKDEAIKVYNECLSLYSIGEVDDVEDITW